MTRQRVRTSGRASWFCKGERRGAAPDPAGEDDPPRAPPLADDVRLIFQAVCRSSRENENTPLPGRPALPARLYASAQGKGWGFPEKQARLFSRKSPAFSVARELSCRYRKFRAHIVCYFKFAVSPRWVQGPAVPGSGVWGLKKPLRPCCPGALLSTQKVSGAYCLLFQICSIAKMGPGTGGSWFGGAGAEEAPASSCCRKLLFS